MYVQQGLVNAAANEYINDLNRLRGPLQGNRTLADVSPAELDAMAATCEATLLQIEYVHALMRPLHEKYKTAAALL